jgi:hypothetical protein
VQHVVQVQGQQTAWALRTIRHCPLRWCTNLHWRRLSMNIMLVDLVLYSVYRINSHVSSSTRLATLKSQWMLISVPWIFQLPKENYRLWFYLLFMEFILGTLLFMLSLYLTENHQWTMGGIYIKCFTFSYS